MSTIHVCPLSRLETTLEETQSKWVLGLAGPGKEIPRPEQASLGFLTLTFNDITEEREGLITPNRDDVKAIIEFARQWNQQGPVVVFCWMGISRSTAACLIAAASLIEDIDEQRLAAVMRALSPMATPNRLMISHADELLGCGGKLVSAVDAIGLGCDAFEGEPFTLDLERFSQS